MAKKKIKKQKAKKQRTKKPLTKKAKTVKKVVAKSKPKTKTKKKTTAKKALPKKKPVRTKPKATKKKTSPKRAIAKKKVSSKKTGKAQGKLTMPTDHLLQAKRTVTQLDEKKANLRSMLINKRKEILKEVRSEISNYIKGETKQLVETALDDGDLGLDFEAWTIRKSERNKEPEKKKTFGWS